jgi:large subunit ribosomal protein L15
MKLHTKTQIVDRRKKRVGHGYGSGKGGHNSGRGTKGQKARNSVPLYFVGSSWVWFKRLPFIRGKSKFNALSPTLTLRIADLNKLRAGTVVNAESLYAAGLIAKNMVHAAKIKVVGTGKVNHKLVLEIPASKSVTKAVTEAGGEVRAQNS